MKRRFVFRGLVVCAACAFLAIVMAGCPIPILPGTSSMSTGSITGKVLAQGQADNSGVTVTAEPTDGIRTVAVQKAISSRRLEKAAGAVNVTTGTDGTYTLSGLAPGTYTLSAVSRDGQARAVSTSVTVSAGSTSQALLMILTRTGQIQGNVTLSDGSDPTGIVVFLAGTSYSAMTDAGGNYLMSYVPAGSGYTLVVSKAGWVSAIRSADVTVNSTTRMEPVVLAPYVSPQTTGSVSGTAILRDAPASAGVFVYLVGTSYICVTDPGGRFSLTGVAPGTYTIMASKEGYASQSATVIVPVGPADPVSFTLSPLGPFYVSYDANGGTGNVPVDPTAYMLGYRVVVPGSGNLARTGYSFAGWNTQADGGGITYTQNQTFYITSSSVVLYAMWTRVVTPPDVSGYWDMTITIDDQPPMRIGWLFIRQTGWNLSVKGQSSGMTWAGSLDGQTLTLTVPVSGGVATFVGTMTDSGVSGSVTAPGYPPGTFTMVHPAPTGHLDLQGPIAGTPLSLNTEYARASAPRTTYSFGFDLGPVIIGRLNFDGSTPVSMGSFVVKMDADEPGEITASVWPNGPGQGNMASTGNLNITRYDGGGIEGTFDLSFQDGSNLSGSFNLAFNVGGTFTMQGTWMGIPISATAPVPTYSDGIHTWSGLNITFFDDRLEVALWLTVTGYLSFGDNQLSLGIQWAPAGGPQINASSDQPPGNLHITSMTAHNLTFSFSASFSSGGAVSGSFSLNF